MKKFLDNCIMASLYIIGAGCIVIVISIGIQWEILGKIGCLMLVGGFLLCMTAWAIHDSIFDK